MDVCWAMLTIPSRVRACIITQVDQYGPDSRAEVRARTVRGRAGVMEQGGEARRVACL